MNIINRIFRKSRVVEIPNNCYMVTPDDCDGYKYRIYKDEEYLNDVYAVVRYGDGAFKKAPINWRREIIEFLEEGE